MVRAREQHFVLHGGCGGSGSGSSISHNVPAGDDERRRRKEADRKGVRVRRE